MSREPEVGLGDTEDTFKFSHICIKYDGSGEFPGWETCSLPLGDAGWSWAEPGVTLHPSIHCLTCDTHGWWREGRWVSV